MILLGIILILVGYFGCAVVAWWIWYDVKEWKDRNR